MVVGDVDSGQVAINNLRNIITITAPCQGGISSNTCTLPTFEITPVVSTRSSQ